MKLTNALMIVNQVCENVPLVHAQHQKLEAAFASFIEKGGDAESLSFIDQVTQAAPLVRAEYVACREAIKTLELMVAPKGEVVHDG